MVADDYPTRLAFVQECARRIQGALQAVGPEFDEVHEDIPSNLFPSGALFPGDAGRIVTELEAEFGKTEYTPSALGFAFLAAPKETIDLDIATRFSLYYPVMPTHSEVLRFVEIYSQGARHIKLPPKYLRLPIEAASGRITLQLRETGGFILLPAPTSALVAALATANHTASTAPGRYGLRPREWIIAGAREYSVADLRNPLFWADQVTASTNKIAARWNAGVLYRIRRISNGWHIELMLCNTTPPSDWGAAEDSFIGAALSVTARAGDLVPMLLPEVESRDFRYENLTWASGRNCDTEITFDGQVITVATQSIPIFTQRRLFPRTLKDRAGGELLPTFSLLGADRSIEILEDVLASMDRYLGEWDAKAATAPGAREAADQIVESKRGFAAEVERFRSGVALLANPSNTDLLAAFRLMNQSFARRFSKPGDSWRLFQLVFIVSELPSILQRTRSSSSADEPTPTVLWFPTGGGKTEAYLGLVVLHAFWDRLRGKPYGVTAFAKFPLRLLSIQQFARVVSVMEHADDVRRLAPELAGCQGDPFSVGYYAGESNTMNLLDWPPSPDRAARPSTLNDALRQIIRDPARLERQLLRHMKVFYCPTCTAPGGGPGRITTTFDEAKPGFRHICRDCHRELKLHLTDTEVIRWLPTVVIATIDKLARLATEPWGRTMFGGAKVRCLRHGYLIDRPADAQGRPVDACPILSCGNPLLPVPSNVDPVPGLLIQDELHLLTESLGAFDSHYETMVIDTARRMRERGIGSGPWKIVGSTATIEGYQQLIRQLYNRGESVRFPERGPIKTESFYNVESTETQRLIVGIRSHGMSHVDTVMKTLLEIHRMTCPLADLPICRPGTALPASLEGVSEADRRSMARRYRTVLTYGINRSEVGQVNRSYEGQLNPYMRRLGLSEFDPDRVVDLTGDSGAQNIQDFLDVMQSGRDSGYYQAVTATSIVGHGVDLDSLNMMVFRGMPHSISEYIQAMSRVGRNDGVPALVVNVYNPNRERDSSHFEAHQKYLELRELLLRNIPTTRFSRQALEKTLPGLLLHHVNYERPLLDLWKRTKVEGFRAEIRDHPDEFHETARRALGLDSAPDPGPPWFGDRKPRLPSFFR